MFQGRFAAFARRGEELARYVLFPSIPTPKPMVLHHVRFMALVFACSALIITAIKRR